MLERDKIYNMDCLEGMKSLPDQCIDIVVTSPPYNKMESRNSGAITSAVIYDNYTDSLDEQTYQQNQIAVLNEMARILKRDGHVFYNHKNRYADGRFISPLEWILKSDLVVRQEIVWDRMIASNIRGWRFWPTDERIYWLQRKDAVRTEMSLDYAKFGSVWHIHPDSAKKTDHPCAYPQELVDRCISSVCKPGDVVLDPYMGSGTTAMSAKHCRCDYIGFELSQTYCELARRRILDKQIELGIYY